MKTVESRNIAVLYSSHNKKGLKDATGAFIPEAKKFQMTHGVPDDNMCPIDCVNQSMILRSHDTLGHIYSVARKAPLDAIAIFCHGWPAGIQIGFNKGNIDILVDLIKRCSRDYLEIVLYACLTAENQKRDSIIKQIGPATQGGFADLLAQKLSENGIDGHVDAHKVRGHTTWVPYVVRFINAEESRAAWLVEPKSTYWYEWVRAVRHTDMRFHFPFMDELEIKMALKDMLVIE